MREHPICLIVLGMHRSGTSALAGMLAELGAGTPNDPLGAAPSNPKGHFESIGIVKIHDEMLSALHSRWMDVRPIDPSLLQSDVAAGFKERLLAALSKSFGRQSLFVLKDPRICRFLPLWESVLHLYGAEPRVVLPIRNPLEVAKSLRARDSMPLPYGLCLWLRHVLDAEAFSRHLPRVFVDYPELLRDWEQTVAGLCRQLQISLPRKTKGDKTGPAFLDENLRRQVASADELTARYGSRSWVAAAYEAFGALIRDPHDAQAMQALDRVRTGFHEATALLGQSAWDIAEQYAVAQSSIGEQQVQHEKALEALYGLAQAHMELGNRLRQQLELAWGERDALRAELEAREVDRKLIMSSTIQVPFEHLPALPPRTPRLAVVCHLFYEDLAAEFRNYLQNIAVPFDLFISTDTAAKKTAIMTAFADWGLGKIEVRIAENRGRDIAPKIVLFRDVYDKYEYFLHIHSKKSLHARELAGWRSFILNHLIGSGAVVNCILGVLLRHPEIGMIASEHFEAVRSSVGWGNCFMPAAMLASRLGIRLSVNGPIDFPAGSMFWGRSAALRPLLDLDLSMEDFEPEGGQKDGTMAHAIEHLYFLICERAGFKWIKVTRAETRGKPESDHAIGLDGLSKSDGPACSTRPAAGRREAVVTP
jgi:hypothetical protein